jgi:ABC-type sugar transport system permease subunit
MLILFSVWKYMGMLVVLYMAGLQAIPNDLYEAAEMDGAAGFKKILYITLPNLRESYVICGIWAIIQSVKVFEQPFIMTQGGPGTSTLVLYQYTWENAFKFYDMGYASAIAYVMGILILILSLLNLKLGKSE